MCIDIHRDWIESGERGEVNRIDIIEHFDKRLRCKSAARHEPQVEARHLVADFRGFFLCASDT